MKKPLLSTVLSLLSGILLPAMVWAGNNERLPENPVIELKEVRIEAARLSGTETGHARLTEWKKVNGEWMPQIELRELEITPEGNRVSEHVKPAPRLYKAVPYGESMIAEINLDEVEISAQRVPDQTQAAASVASDFESPAQGQPYDLRGSFDRLLNYFVKKSVSVIRDFIPYRGE